MHLLVLIVACTLPVDDISQRCSATTAAGAGCRMLIGFHIGTAGFFTHRTQAEADFLLFGVHLDDLKVMVLSGFQLYAGASGIRGFRVVAKTFNALGNL